MSESDDLLTSNDIFSYPNDTVLSVLGPNYNATEIRNIGSFRNNESSSMQMPRNFNHYRYAGSSYDQGSMYRNFNQYRYAGSNYDQGSMYRRGNSPMSIRSAFNGRSGSRMSAGRSIDTAASCVSAASITMALETMNFSNYEARKISDAFNKRFLPRFRKIAKRKHRKRRLRYGGESGEQGSDSSISSDEKSRRTVKENMSSGSTKTDTSHFRRKRSLLIKENYMYRDSTENFRPYHSKADALNTTQNSVRSMIAGPNMHSFRNMPVSDHFNNMKRLPLALTMPQKERFESKYLQPSQRFHNSVTSATIPENAEDDNHVEHQKASSINIKNAQSTSKQKKTINVPRKRLSDSDHDISLLNQKRRKTSTPCKIHNSVDAGNSIPKETTENYHNNDKMNDFQFAKPVHPVRKCIKENLFAKSAGPLTDTLEQTVIPSVNVRKSQPEASVELEVENDSDDEQSNISQNTTDLSKRPSFLKRKLYSQGLDVTEKKNTSRDNSDSPKNSIYSGIQKEKHKTRKHQQVTTTSCLSRDVLPDQSGLLDLIVKIVPLEHMNVTNQTNKTDVQNTKNKSDENDNSWDVTSIICKQNADDVSETYTDEEVFNATVNKLTKENVSKKPTPTKGKNCEKSLKLIPKQKFNGKDDVPSKSVKDCIQAFWDTDFESEEECRPPNSNGDFNLLENHREEITQPKEIPKFHQTSSVLNSKQPGSASTVNVSTFINNEVSSVQKFNNTTLTIRSHRNTKIKNIRENVVKTGQFEPQKNKTGQSGKINESIDLQNIEETTRKETNNKKTFQTKQNEQQRKNQSNSRKNTDKKMDSTQLEEQNKKEKRKVVQSKQTCNNQNEDVVENGQQSKKQCNGKMKNDNKYNSQLGQKTKGESINKKKITSKQISNNQNEDLDENEQKIKKQSKSKKRNDTKTDNTQLENKKTEEETINKKTVQCKKISNNQNDDEVENKQIRKQSNIKKKNDKKTDNTQLEEQNKNESINKKIVQSKQTCNNQNGDLVKNKQQINEQSNIKKKDELAQDLMTTKKETNTNKKSAETKLQNEKLNTKNNISSVTEDITKENNSSYMTLRSFDKRNETLEPSNLSEENNSCYRKLRSCRIKRNETLNQSNLNNTRTLRSRQIDLSSTLEGNLTKVNNTKASRNKSRLNDISLAAELKAKLTKFRRYKISDNDPSDESFSISPWKTISRVNPKLDKTETFVSKLRNRIPTKKYWDYVLDSD